MSDMTELFTRDPLKLTRDDIEQIIVDLRKRRSMFKAAPGAGSKTAKPKMTEKQAAALSLNLGDIEL